MSGSFQAGRPEGTYENALFAKRLTDEGIEARDPLPITE